MHHLIPYEDLLKLGLSHGDKEHSQTCCEVESNGIWYGHWNPLGG
jgi:hypothetical protein